MLQTRITNHEQTRHIFTKYPAQCVIAITANLWQAVVLVWTYKSIVVFDIVQLVVVYTAGMFFVKDVFTKRYLWYIAKHHAYSVGIAIGTVLLCGQMPMIGAIALVVDNAIDDVARFICINRTIVKREQMAAAATIVVVCLWKYWIGDAGLWILPYSIALKEITRYLFHETTVNIYSVGYSCSFCCPLTLMT